MNLLSLDFDGVLHRGSDPVWMNYRANAPVWEIALALKVQKRFAWVDKLVEALHGADVSIVLHTTWRKRFDDATLKQFLPDELAGRVISLDGLVQGRNELVGDDYVMAAIDLLQPSTVCVIDDRPEFFSSGRVKAWMQQHHGSFIWCDPETGLQAEGVNEQLVAWSHIETSRAEQPVPSF